MIGPVVRTISYVDEGSGSKVEREREWEIGCIFDIAQLAIFLCSSQKNSSITKTIFHSTFIFFATKRKTLILSHLTQIGFYNPSLFTSISYQILLHLATFLHTLSHFSTTSLTISLPSPLTRSSFIAPSNNPQNQLKTPIYGTSQKPPWTSFPKPY